MRNDQPTWELRTAMIAACLPSVFGTLVLASLTMMQRTQFAGGVGLPDPGILHAVVVLVVTLSLLAAAYGPLILPLAAAAVWVEQRRSAVTDPIAGGVLLLALIGAVASYGWVLDAVELL